MKIGCDIGNVVRDNSTGEAIIGAIDSLKQLQEQHQIFFISKAKEHYRQKAKDFLKQNNLDNIPIYFVYEDDQKVEIDKKLKLDVMIDDKMTILKDFNKNVLKIWFQIDQKKIDGCRKYQKELFDQMTIVKSWDQILQILNQQLNYTQNKVKKSKIY